MSGIAKKHGSDHPSHIPEAPPVYEKIYFSHIPEAGLVYERKERKNWKDLQM